MKKIILLILILFVTGCTDYRELSDMAVVSNIAIDKKDDEYRIIVQVLDASSSSTSKGESTVSPSVIVYENTGKTMHEAFRNVILESPKKLYAGHVDTIIIGEETLKEGVSDFIDYILRDPELEKDFNLLTTTDPIDEVMNVVPPLISIPSENVSTSIEIASKKQGMIDDVSFDEFVSNILVDGIDPVLPSVYIKETNTDNEEINPSKRLVLSKKLGVFNNDKFVTFINEDASLGYNFLNNKEMSPVVSFKCDKDNYASIELLKVKPSFEYDKKSNKIKIKIDLIGSLSELDCNIDITKDEGIKKLENLFKTRVEEILNETINAEKKYDSDFLGIGKYLYQNDYKYYMKVKDKLPEIIKNVKADFDIKVTYTQKTSLKKGDEKH